MSDPTSDQRVEPGEVTHLLGEIEAGQVDPAALLPLMYRELKRLASARMDNERADHTLQPTALVHEAYLRLIGDANQQAWDSRGHFFGAAAEAMRRILVENARRRKRVRHGGELKRVTLSDGDVIQAPADHHDLLSLDEALAAFAEESPQRAELVKLRYFAGLGEAEAAEVLGISRATASRWWTFSRAWLLERMGCIRWPRNSVYCRRKKFPLPRAWLCYFPGPCCGGEG